MRGVGEFFSNLVGQDVASIIVVTLCLVALYRNRFKFKDWYDLSMGEKEAIIAMIAGVIIVLLGNYMKYVWFR